MTETRFDPLPVSTDGDDTPRRAGFELEFSGIDLAKSSALLADVVGGRVVETSTAEHDVQSDDLGDFVVEIDWAFLKKQAGKIDADAESLRHKVMEHISAAATTVVPLEIVTPPLPLDALSLLNRLVDKLAAAGAGGTDSGAISAFGLHINVTTPDLSCGSLYRYLTAFCLLQWWLLKMQDIDLARRMTGYVKLFDASFVDHLVSANPASTDALMGLYLKHNPTRDRALDMLPIFSELDKARVDAAVDDSRVKARPAFHYRLPDCRIGAGGWSPAEAWNYWCVVERLANSEKALAAVSDAFQERFNKRLLMFDDKAWCDDVNGLLRQHALISD